MVLREPSCRVSVLGSASALHLHPFPQSEAEVSPERGKARRCVRERNSCKTPRLKDVEEDKWGCEKPDLHHSASQLCSEKWQNTEARRATDGPHS